MTVSPEIPTATLDEWLSELKPYQRDAFRELLKTVTPEDAAMRWVTSYGSGNIVGFGGSQDTKPFWDRFKLEFRKFVCDESAYVEEKKSLALQGPITRALLISSISAAIGATIGQTAALLAPAVVVMLFLTGAMGRNAYCNDTGTSAG